MLELNKMRILNLYAGIGGNRKLWPKECKITAVEYSWRISEIYRKSFPNDKLIFTDAHKYLLKHYKEFDFIWSSPPCQTHSVTNHFLNAQGIIRYPHMCLYQEIIFLKHFFKGKWVVENVKSYYEPLVKPFEIGRHYFWSNFHISKIKQPKDEIGKMHGNRQKGHDKSIEKRNTVNPELGLHIFKEAFKVKQMKLN